MSPLCGKCMDKASEYEGAPPAEELRDGDPDEDQIKLWQKMNHVCNVCGTKL